MSGIGVHISVVTARRFSRSAFALLTAFALTISPLMTSVAWAADPVADPQSVTTAEDAPTAITLTGSDLDGDPLTYSIVSGPSSGTLSGTAPNVTYTPNANYNGSDSFTFRANDGTTNSNTATVSITVTPVNDPPVANPQSTSTNENTPKSITLVATDIDSTALTYSIVSPPSNGSISAGTGSTRTYTPTNGYSGSDSFTFRANDGTTNSNTATVSITVINVNDPPVANPQSVTTAEDTNRSITLTASDPDGDPLTYSIVSGPSSGTLSGTAPNVTYTPNANYNGSDSFTFRANDGTTNSNTATVSITVTPVNDPPVANPQSTSTNENTPKSITLVATDIDSTALTYSIVSPPSNGSISAGTGSTRTYTPTNGYSGSDSFTFRANDGTTNSNTATVSITVINVNDPPVANPQSVTTAEDTNRSITLTATDPDGDPLTYSIVSSPSNGSISGRNRRHPHLHPHRQLQRVGLVHLPRQRRDRQLQHRHRLHHRHPGQRPAGRQPPVGDHCRRHKQVHHPGCYRH